MILRCLRIVQQIAILWLLFETSNWLVKSLHLPLPGNVVGMLLLLALLSCRVLQPKHIQEGANLLLSHMSFFFIPFAVGLMNWFPFFSRHALVLAAALVAGATVGLAVTGYAVQFFMTKGGDSPE